jgi:hypothetical protein
MGLDDYALGTIEWDGSEIEVPSCCPFVRYRDSKLTFFSTGVLDGNSFRDDIDTTDVYHVARAFSIESEDDGFRGYWLKTGWKKIKLADPGATYIRHGCRFSM